MNLQVGEVAGRARVEVAHPHVQFAPEEHFRSPVATYLPMHRQVVGLEDRGWKAVPLSQLQKQQSRTMNFETYCENLAFEKVAGSFWAERHSSNLEAVVEVSLSQS